jgi:hypothetical protein
VHTPVVWGYELSSFVVVVKETLSELELPYKQVGSQFEQQWKGKGRKCYSASVHACAVWGVLVLL